MKEALLVIDKTPGPTSFDVVRQVKRLVAGEKVGHTGSLDPFASGVLVLLLGRATKLSNVLLNADKSYYATVKLGEETDTMDRTGQVGRALPVPALTREDVEACLKSFVGEWHQTPPMFSAKKIHGVRLYELARQNISVRRQPIPVNLYEMKLVKFESPVIEFEVHCSKGTYIRSLAAEIGQRLGTVAHLAELRRLSCGDFRLEESITLERLKNELPACMETGYRNYVKLLRAEGIVRRPVVAPASARTRDSLPIPANSGNSFVN